MKQLIYFGMLFCLTACGQETHIMKTLPKRTPQDIKNLYQKVEHFQEEPHYGMYIHASNTNFEIRVNDRVVHMNYSVITNETNYPGAYFPINTCIDASGLQTLEIRMYPCWNRKTRQLEPSLKNAYVKISIVKRLYNTRRVHWGDEEYIYFWETPIAQRDEKDPMKYFIYPEKLEYIHKDTFTAEVPYHIDELDNAVNLYTTDASEIQKLTERILPYYEALKQVYEENDTNIYATWVYEKEKRIAQQLYFNKEESEKRWGKDLLASNKELVEKESKMQPLKNYKLRFYANGKLICLVSTNLKLTGLNNSALYSVGEKTTRFHALFYLPKGGTEFLLY